MVCGRCKMVVQDVLTKEGFSPLNVELGEVNLKEELTKEQYTQVKHALMAMGFVVINDKQSRIIEKIKNSIVKLVHYSEVDKRINLSTYISGELHQDYNNLSNLFSEIEGTTIEQYYITQKIERVKELIMYDELSLSEIAIQMNYSSISHLSKQFKKVTGVTPSFYKQLKANKRTAIDEL